MTMERLRATVELGERAAITLVGELDPATVTILDAAVEDAMAGGAVELVVDMAQVTFVDSSGLRSLIVAHQRVAPNPLVVRAPTPFAVQLFAITGLDEQFVLE